jgi:hypothetical protein
MQLGGKLAILLLLVYVIACSSSSSPDGGSGHTWSQYSKDEYVAGCKETGGRPEFCSCMLTKVQEKYAIEDLRELAPKIQKGQAPADYTEFMKKAAGECGGGATASPSPAASPSPSKSDDSDD